MPADESSLSALYPPSAFHFRVVFPGQSVISFQEVSGIGAEVDLEEVVEGGENRFVHRLPRGVKHPKLVLKRGILELDSPLVQWCISVFEGDFAEPISPKLISVYLLDQEHNPIRGWDFDNAYPVNWEIDSFNSTKNEVAIEKIELSYNYLSRTQ